MNERMDGHGGPDGGPAMVPDRDGMRTAGASEQQIQAIDDLVFTQESKRIELRAAADKAALSLDHLMKAQHPDEKGLMQAIDALTQARGEMLKADVELRIKVDQALGEEVVRKLRAAGSAGHPGHGDPVSGVARPDQAPRDAGTRPPANPAR